MCYIDPMTTKTFDPNQTPEERWADSALQFMRLLAEIDASGVTADQLSEVATSMDLEVGQVLELLDRARCEWDAYVATIPR
jgi:hypothetical protein